MRIGYFDCFSGVSGNMILGAMLDAGWPLAQLEADLAALSLPGWRLEVKQEQRHGLSGTHVAVVPTRHEHAHRHLDDIEEIIEKSQLPSIIKENAIAVFTRLAQAEGLVHGVPAHQVHFHEVGAVDSIVDIVGAVAGFFRLQLDQVWVSPIHVGCGNVQTQHGLLPVPAPATAELLKGVPVYATGCEGELATPTGVAILRTVANGFGAWPAMVVKQTGHGLGTKELAHPNALRLVIGEATQISSGINWQIPVGLQHDVVQVLEANIDDMNPQLYTHVLEELLAAGALDVFYTPIIMKKGRPGCKITALVTNEVQQACLTTIMQQTTTLGVRMYSVDRAKLERHWQTVTLNEGPVRVKIGSWLGQVVNAAPEYEDCRQLAQASGRPLKDIYNQAQAAAQALKAGAGQAGCNCHS